MQAIDRTDTWVRASSGLVRNNICMRLQQRRFFQPYGRFAVSVRHLDRVQRYKDGRGPEIRVLLLQLSMHPSEPDLQPQRLQKQAGPVEHSPEAVETTDILLSLLLPTTAAARCFARLLPNAYSRPRALHAPAATMILLVNHAGGSRASKALVKVEAVTAETAVAEAGESSSPGKAARGAIYVSCSRPACWDDTVGEMGWAGTRTGRCRPRVDARCGRHGCDWAGRGARRERGNIRCTLALQPVGWKHAPGLERDRHRPRRRGTRQIAGTAHSGRGRRNVMALRDIPGCCWRRELRRRGRRLATHAAVTLRA